MKYKYNNFEYFILALARFSCFTTFASGGGSVRPPGDRPLIVVELHRKTVDASRRDLAISHNIFSPRPKFNLCWSGEMSNFREK